MLKLITTKLLNLMFYLKEALYGFLTVSEKLRDDPNSDAQSPFNKINLKIKEYKSEITTFYRTEKPLET